MAIHPVKLSQTEKQHLSELAEKTRDDGVRAAVDAYLERVDETAEPNGVPPIQQACPIWEEIDAIIKEIQDVLTHEAHFNHCVQLMIENRPTCWQCIRPESHCHCKLISPFFAHCNTVLLQHPREKKRFYSTAKLIKQWISNCKIVRGIEFDQTDILDLFPHTKLAVLFPGGNAVPANSIRLSDATSVIVIDGTWSEAKKIYRQNKWIAALPHISLSPLLRSRYRIRKQPRPECLSTIEALAYMFIENSSSLKQKTAAYSNLLEGFDRMVDTHLQSIPADKLSYYDSGFE